MAIDPAQSFSNALNQGLGVFKAYRDEARDAAEMEFSRKLREKHDLRLEKSLAMEERQHNQSMKIGENTLKVNEEYWSPEQVEYRKKMQSLGLLTAESQAEVGRVNAAYAEEDAQLGLEGKRAQIAQSRAATRAYGLRGGGGGGGGGGSGRSGGATGLSRENQAFLEVAASWARGKPPNPKSAALVGRKQAQMAAMVVGAEDFARVLQDPLGNWRNDPNVVRNVIPFTGMSIPKTEKLKGYKNSNVVGIGLDPKDKNTFVITFRGTNVKTGKVENYTGRQNVDTFLGKGSGYASVFAEIARRPDARAQIAKQFAMSQPVEAQQIIKSEIDFVEQRMKNMKLKGQDETMPEAYKKLVDTYAGLTERNPYYVSAFLIKGLARQEQSRYQ